jgi:hypothetical protein
MGVMERSPILAGADPPVKVKEGSAGNSGILTESEPGVGAPLVAHRCRAPGPIRSVLRLFGRRSTVSIWLGPKRAGQNDDGARHCRRSGRSH